jgi:integrase
VGEIRVGDVEPASAGVRAGALVIGSMLIAKGLNVVFVSRQLGHANPTLTLPTYGHLFERANHAEAARKALEASYAAMAGSSG